MKLRAKGYTDFMGVKVPNLEGAFGKEKRCVLVKTVADIHRIEVREVNQLINSNIDEFEFGIDIIDLKVAIIGNDSGYLTKLGFTQNSINASKNIYLLSEQGYMALVGLMKTDKAKEIRKDFRRKYFLMREQMKHEQIEKELVYKIYKGGQEGIVASKQLTEIEKRPLLEKIEEQKPKVEIYEKFIDNGENIDFSLLGKTLGTGRNKLMQILRDLKILQEDKFLFMGVKSYGAKHNIPEQRYINKEYFIIKQKELKNGTFKPVTLVTPKGQEYIYKKLSKEGLI